MTGRRARGRWSPFSPGTLASWYKSDVGVTANGSNLVTSWADRSGHGYTMGEAPSPADPTYQALGWGGSKPTVSFTPQRQLRTTTALKNLTDGIDTNFSVFAVVNVTNSAADKFLVQWTNELTSFVAVAFDASERIVLDNNNGGNLVGNSSAAGAHVVGVVSGGGTADFYLDGDIDVANGLITTDSSTNNYVALGTNAFGFNGFNGLISEIVIYGSKLNFITFQAFRRYARNRWPGLP